MFLRAFICCLLLAGAGLSQLKAQVRVYGYVYDEKKLPLQGVSVLGSDGRGVGTNLYGSYSIDVRPGDTLSYSFLGFRTEYFAAGTEEGMVRKDVYLYPDNLTLEQVKVLGQRNRVKDSLERRAEYGHIFAYKAPGVLDYGKMALTSPVTFLAELFDFKGRRRNKQFKNTLLDFEQQSFIESRIPFGLVGELTGLEGDELAMFYNQYLRDYEFAKHASQYDIHQRVLQSFRQYRETRKDTLDHGN